MAYEELVRRYRDVAVRTATIVGGADDAEDAAQEAFVKAYAALGRFRAGSPFRPWLLRIVANEARNRRRSAGRRASLAVRAAKRSVLAAADLGLTDGLRAERAAFFDLFATQDQREGMRAFMEKRQPTWTGR